MPMWMLKEFELAIPRLEAQEAIRSVNIGMVASGAMKKEARDRVVAQWKQAANDGARPAFKPGMKAAAQALGIAIVEESRHG